MLSKFLWHSLSKVKYMVRPPETFSEWSTIVRFSWILSWKLVSDCWDNIQKRYYSRVNFGQGMSPLLLYLTYIITIFAYCKIHWKTIIGKFYTFTITSINQFIHAYEIICNVNIFTTKIEVFDEIIHQYQYLIIGWNFLWYIQWLINESNTPPELIESVSWHPWLS